MLSLLAALALVPAPVAIRHDRRAAAVALAGPDVLVLSEPALGKDDLSVVAVPRTGGPARTLLRIPDAILGGQVAGSPQRVAALVTADTREDEVRVYSGPPSGPLKLVRRAPQRYDGKTFAPSTIDVDGDRLLLVESADSVSIGDDEGTPTARSRGSVYDGAKWTPIPWADGKRRPFQIAGPYASVIASDPYRIEVVELATGRAVTTVTPRAGDVYAAPSDLRADGRIAVGAVSGIEIAGPNEPQHNLPNSGRLGNPLFAGPAFLALDDQHNTLNFYAPDGVQTPLGPPSRSENQDSDADDEGVAWLFNGCVRYAPFGAPVAAPAHDPCPTTEVSLYLIGPSTKLHGNHARVAVMCVNGPRGRCRGRLHVRTSRHGPVVARGTFDLAMSDRWQYARVHFDAATVAKMRREKGGDFVVHAVMRNGTVSSFEPYESEFTVDV